ncbi:MAG: UpxY family transcription antiterminator [Bacteroidales bacterium]|nr:UpxY family transcription antiterminator [Bacteroidales bacterium]
MSLPLETSENNRWFVLRAYKNEKKAEDVLGGEDGLPYFIPKQYAVRVYHGKKTRRLVPVIPGLVFVQAGQKAICDFKKRHNFLQFVMRTRNAADKDYLIVPDKQMADFMRVAGQYETEVAYYAPEELHLEKGARVRILGGPFDGVEGTFMKVEGARARRLVVQIPNTLAAVVSVEPDLVEVIKD